MSKPDGPSPAQLARTNRMRLAAEESARAMDDAAKQASAVRKNMARLRELRLAKEEVDLRNKIAAGNTTKPKKRKR
jgi:hypothetical protein